jgi:hypothetical protein
LGNLKLTKFTYENAIHSEENGQFISWIQQQATTGDIPSAIPFGHTIVSIRHFKFEFPFAAGEPIINAVI